VIEAERRLDARLLDLEHGRAPLTLTGGTPTFEAF